MPQRDPDYYAVLNLPRESSAQEIHEQYRRLVMVFHPDRNSGNKWSERQLTAYNEAYQVLSDPSRKAAYDKSHGQRRTDNIDFEATFDTPPDKAAEADQQSWTFDAASRGSRPEDVNKSAAENGSRSGSLFDDAHVTMAAAPHHAVGPHRREWHPWRYFAGFATALVLVAVVKVIDNSDLDDTPHSTSTASAAHLSNSEGSKNGRDTDPPPAVVQALKSASQAAQITSADAHEADTQRHDQAAALHQRLAPYWIRYKKDREEAADDGDKGEQVLQNMEGGAGTEGAGVHQLKETALRADLSSLDDLSNALQDQFDDLTYTSEDENVATVLSQIDQELTSLERADTTLRQEMASDESGKKV